MEGAAEAGLRLADAPDACMNVVGHVDHLLCTRTVVSWKDGIRNEA
jgi:hypothetical protein